MSKIKGKHTHTFTHASTLCRVSLQTGVGRGQGRLCGCHRQTPTCKCSVWSVERDTGITPSYTHVCVHTNKIDAWVLFNK